jgi:heme-degrading monooxygenase HmoA
MAAAALVKWVTCEVAPTQAAEFSRAQERWATLVDVAGFRCQLGGWDEAEPGIACVLAVWRDAATYAAFMRDSHDRLSYATGQVGTYDALRVATGDVLFQMPGAEDDGVRALARAQVVRVADCSVRPGREEHFREVQREVWAPAMADADGMLGGLFSALGAQRYLVTTGWRDAASHARYARYDVPLLRRTAAASEDLLQIRGHVVRVTRGWSVTAPTERC